MPQSPASPAAHDVQTGVRRDLGYNFVVHAVDAGLFGAGLGLASFVSVVPLFLATLTASPLLVGLISSIQPLGWHLPQILTSRRVGRLPRLMPMILRMTANERIPFFVLAAVVWGSGRLPGWFVIAAVYLLVLWIGVGGGLTATAFQTLVAKIVPPGRHGLFYGVKTASANLTIALGAIAAGRLIERLGTPNGFAACIALAGVAVVLSWIALARTREPATEPVASPAASGAYRHRLRAILGQDRAFRWFVILRVLSQVAIMATAFYIVYASQELGLGAGRAGLLTGVFAGAQMVGNPLLGWAGDRFGRRAVLAFGMACAGASALVAWVAPSLGWFYLVYVLAGLSYVATWTVPLAMLLEFGDASDRPAYIGLGNTLFAPSVVLAPLAGGWLAQTAGYPATFLASVVGAVAAIVVLVAFVEEPRRASAPGSAGAIVSR